MNLFSMLCLRARRVRHAIPAVAFACAASLSCPPASAQTAYSLAQTQTINRPVVDFQTQAVTYSLPVIGTAFRFNYRSNAVGQKWRLSVYHLYDVATETLSPGDGRPTYAIALFARPQASSWFSGTEMAVPAADDSELYVFNNKGQHLRTLNALTGAVLFRFDYSPAGLLTAIEDGYGNKAQITRLRRLYDGDRGAARRADDF